MPAIPPCTASGSNADLMHEVTVKAYDLKLQLPKFVDTVDGAIKEVDQQINQCATWIKSLTDEIDKFIENMISQTKKYTTKIMDVEQDLANKCTNIVSKPQKLLTTLNEQCQKQLKETCSNLFTMVQNKYDELNGIINESAELISLPLDQLANINSIKDQNLDVKEQVNEYVTLVEFRMYDLQQSKKNLQETYQHFEQEQNRVKTAIDNITNDIANYSKQKELLNANMDEISNLYKDFKNSIQHIDQQIKQLQNGFLQIDKKYSNHEREVRNLESYLRNKQNEVKQQEDNVNAGRIQNYNKYRIDALNKLVGRSTGLNEMITQAIGDTQAQQNSIKKNYEEFTKCVQKFSEQQKPDDDSNYDIINSHIEQFSRIKSIIQGQKAQNGELSNHLLADVKKFLDGNQQANELELMTCSILETLMMISDNKEEITEYLEIPEFKQVLKNIEMHSENDVQQLQEKAVLFEQQYQLIQEYNELKNIYEQDKRDAIKYIKQIINQQENQISNDDIEQLKQYLCVLENPQVQQ